MLTKLCTNLHANFYTKPEDKTVEKNPTTKTCRQNCTSKRKKGRSDKFVKNMKTRLTSISLQAKKHTA